MQGVPALPKVHPLRAGDLRPLSDRRDLRVRFRMWLPRTPALSPPQSPR